MRSRTLIEELAVTALAAPIGVDPALLDEEQRWLNKAHRLRSEHISPRQLIEERRLAAKIEMALERIWQRIEDECGENGAEYVALRRGRPIGLKTLRQLLKIG